MAFFYSYKTPKTKNIVWGVSFSQKHAKNMGLDWRDLYLALLDDLGAENIKLAAHWDLIESQPGVYDFSDLDWQMDEAAIRERKVMMAIGMKTPRWPECHVPEWAKGIGKEKQQEAILEMIEEIVLRYRGHDALALWQVENEPLFPFGECPWIDKEFLKKEAALVKSLDKQNNRVVISDSGEGSWWFEAARIGDIVGVTIYRKAYFDELKIYVDYPIPPAFYAVKAKIVDWIFKKPVICGELQAEPWVPDQVYDGADGDGKTMSLEQLRENIAFAENTGLDTFYLWGSEWWYWMKVEHSRPEFWEEVRIIFR